MTWIDITLIIIWILFLVTGARLGSVWIAACVTGGFFGAFLVDYYALPAASMVGHFRGAMLAASLLLFLGGLLPLLALGAILSRIASKILLGLINGIFGLIAGALAGLMFIAILFLVFLPRVPGVERSRAWKKSIVARPLQGFVEDVFNNPRFRPSDWAARIEKEAGQELGPMTEKAKDAVQNISEKIADTVKK